MNLPGAKTDLTLNLEHPAKDTLTGEEGQILCHSAGRWTHPCSEIELNAGRRRGRLIHRALICRPNQQLSTCSAIKADSPCLPF